MPCYDPRDREDRDRVTRVACDMSQFIKCWFWREDLDAYLSTETLDWMDEHEKLDKKMGRKK